MISVLLLQLILWMIDKAFWDWWLDPLLALLQKLEVIFGWTNSYFGIVLNAFRVLTYFVPITHQIAIIGVILALILIKTIMAIYNQVAQIIP